MQLTNFVSYLLLINRHLTQQVHGLLDIPRYHSQPLRHRVLHGRQKFRISLKQMVETIGKALPIFLFGLHVLLQRQQDLFRLSDTKYFIVHIAHI